MTPELRTEVESWIAWARHNDVPKDALLDLFEHTLVAQLRTTEGGRE